MTMLRAMELGKAIIASDVPGVRDYITDKQNGILVPVEDVEVLAAAIRALIGDAAERARLGANAQKAHAEKFTHKMSVAGIIAYAWEATQPGQQASPG